MDETLAWGEHLGLKTGAGLGRLCRLYSLAFRGSLHHHVIQVSATGSAGRCPRTSLAKVTLQSCSEPNFKFGQKHALQLKTSLLYLDELLAEKPLDLSSTAPPFHPLFFLQLQTRQLTAVPRVDVCRALGR